MAKKKTDVVVTKNVRLIDNVTTVDLELALRACGIQVPFAILDKIIDLVELLEEKGSNTTIKDIIKLQNEWKQSNNYGDGTITNKTTC